MGGGTVDFDVDMHSWRERFGDRVGPVAEQAAGEATIVADGRREDCRWKARFAKLESGEPVV